MLRRTFLKFLGFGATATLAKEKPHIELLEFYIAGLRYYEGKHRVFQVGQKLLLKREKTNPYDSNAIEIYSNTTKLGYIPKKENKIIAKLLDQDVSLMATISKFNNNEESWHKIKVKLYQV